MFNFILNQNYTLFWGVCLCHQKWKYVIVNVPFMKKSSVITTLGEIGMVMDMAMLMYLVLAE